MLMGRKTTDKQKNIEPTTRYSFIYNNLVSNSGDFIGLVAYSIYKQEKIEYIKKFEDAHQRSPNPDELKFLAGVYQRLHKLDCQLRENNHKIDSLISQKKRLTSGPQNGHQSNSFVTNLFCSKYLIFGKAFVLRV